MAEALEGRMLLSSNLTVGYDSTGISSLKYGNDTLVTGETFAIDGYYTLNSDGTTYTYQNGYQNYTSSGFIPSSTGGSVTFTYQLNGVNTLAVTATYSQPAVNNVAAETDQLDMTFNITNLPGSGQTIGGVDIYVAQLHFPSAIPYTYINYSASGNTQQWAPLSISSNSGPGIIEAPYNTGTMDLVNDSTTAPQVYTSLWTLNNNGTGYFIWAGTGPKAKQDPNSLAYFYDSLQPGQSDYVHDSLRFGVAGTAPLAMATDVEQSYANKYPDIVNWPDRRPIGELNLTSPPLSTSYVNNPEGWNSAQNIDYTSYPTGLNNFGAWLMNSYVPNSLPILHANNAQGMIVWDVEGQRWPQATTYIGDPVLATTVNHTASDPNGILTSIEQPVLVNGTYITPMAYNYTGPGALTNPITGQPEPLINQFFQAYRAAGYRVGETLRPSNIAFDGFSAPSGSTTKVNGAPEQPSITFATATEVATVEAKIQYAYANFGCTLFYLDSNLGYDRDAIRKMQTDFPYVLIIPEQSGVALNGTAAPYGQWMGHDATGPTPEVYGVYPAAFGVIKPADGSGARYTGESTAAINARTAADFAATQINIDKGSIILFRSWFTDSYNPAASHIYGDFPTPGQPINLSISAANAVTNLTWSPVTISGTGVSNTPLYSVCTYNIYRSTSSGGTYTLIASGVFNPNYTDTNAGTPIDTTHAVTNNVKYFYKVTAVDGVGEGAASSIVSATPNAAPTVATAAFSALATPITANLSVLGNYAAGESSLSYAWSCATVPANLTQPTYSRNNSHAASTTVATFYQSGKYTFTATITDPNGLTTTSSTTITINQTLTTLAVSPPSTTLTNSQSVSLSAIGYDQFSSAMSSQPSFTWALGGGVGSIDSTGKYTAPSSGPGSATITATNGSITGSATITVNLSNIAAVSGGNVRLVRDTSNNTLLDVYSSSTLLYSTTFSTLGALTVTGTSGSDTITLDFSGGASPIPSAGISIDGQANSDSLVIIGTSSNDTAVVAAGSLTYNGSLINFSNIESLTINSGTGSDALTQNAQPSTALAFIPTATATLTINAGSFTFPASTGGIVPQTLGTLSIASGATVTLASDLANPTNRNVLIVSNLILTGSPGNYTSKLDLGANDLVIKNASAFSSAIQQLTAGFNAQHGYWNGTAGITSSAAATDSTYLTTLGILQNPSAGTFDDQPTAAGDVLIKYTTYGDADLNGSLNGADYQQIDNGFGTGATTWANGDFNYDGIVNGSDFALIDNAFNQQTAIAAPASIIATVVNTVTTPKPAIAAAAPFVPTPSNIFANHPITTQTLDDIFDTRKLRNSSPLARYAGRGPG